MKKAFRALFSLSLISGLTLGAVAPAQAIPADNPVIGPLLPSSLQRYVSFAPVKRTYTNPEGGKVHHEIIRSGFANSSPLFGVDRNAEITIEVRNQVSRSFEKAFFLAGVQFGCQAGIGNTSLKVYAYSDTQLTVNGKSSVTGRTEPLTNFVQKSIKLGKAIAATAAEGAASEGVGTAVSALKLAQAIGDEAIATRELGDTISTTGNADTAIKANPHMKPDFKQTYQVGRLTELPLFVLRYSPGVNRVRLSGLGLQVRGCIGVAKLRPFVRTIGQTKSGNYLDYATYGDDYLFIPNKFFRMDT